MNKRAFVIAAGIFAVCAAAWWLYWVAYGRFHEKTKDAYVNGNMTLVTPQQAGIITVLFADNTQLVEEGQPLAMLEDHEYRIALEKAKADLGAAVRDVAQYFAQVEEFKAKKRVEEARLERALLDVEHRRPLVSDGSVALEEFQHAELALAAAGASFAEVEAGLIKALAEVEGTTIPTHPRVEQRKASLREAFLRLERCLVRAPVKGIISQRSAQVGQWTLAHSPLMALIPLDQIWIDANFREVSLKNLRIGQPVELTADMYGGSEIFHGKVVGLNAGTGSVFSVLPPQNATGNWIKVVQRVPVKISLEADELRVKPLVLGLSMVAHVDTHDRTGRRLPAAATAAPLYETHIYEKELDGAEALIEAIIAENR